MTARYSNPRVLFTTSLGAFITPFTSSLISFSVPEIGSSLDATFTYMVWVPMAYLIALPSLMILFGKLSDIFGRTKFYAAGFLVFGTGGLIAVFSNSVFMLIFSSLVMGVGASLLSVNAVAIVNSVYPPDSRGGALGINAMSVYLGLTSGPVLAGVFVEYFGWQSLFYLVSGFAYLSLIPTYLFISRLDIPTKRSGIDYVGFISFLLSVLSIVLYLSFSEIYGWVSTSYLLAAGLVLLAFFIMYERKHEEPMLDLKLFTSNRTFSAANFTAFLNYISTFAIVFVFSIYFTVVSGLSPAESGLLLTVEPVFMVIFSPISGRLSDRIGSRFLASAGMLLIAVSFFAIFLLLGRVGPEAMAYPLGVIGIGFGLFSAPNTNSVMGSVPRKDSGTASGTLGTMRFVGQLMSLAIMSSILADAMPRAVLLQLFSGINSGVTSVDVTGFVAGLGTVMLLAGILSLAGVFTSLVRNA